MRVGVKVVVKVEVVVVVKVGIVVGVGVKVEVVVVVKVGVVVGVGVVVKVKIKPSFNLDHKEVIPELSIPAKYARDLYRQGFEMAVALRESNKLYGVDIHKIASELGYRGGKFRKWRRNHHGNKDQTSF